MPSNLLAEYVIVHVERGEMIAPPYVAITTDEKLAKREALEWAESQFGEGEYSIGGVEKVGRLQSRRSF